MSVSGPPIILKKVKKAAHGHHGGAWKIAYADFVTAMMAFFLLMWLISMTTPEQKQGLADYFAPASVSQSQSGSGGILGGTAFDIDGARMAGSTPRIALTVATPGMPKSPETNVNGADAMQARPNPMSAEGAQSLDEKNFREAAESLRQAMQQRPDLAELSKNVIIDETLEGLRIQIVDQEGRAMFPSGRAEPYERTRTLIQAVAKTLLPLPNRIDISGHTDSAPMNGDGKYTNWELTSDRANAVRRILTGSGLPNGRVSRVVGKADTEPLFPEDPGMAANRRLSIVLLREAPPAPPDLRP